MSKTICANAPRGCTNEVVADYSHCKKCLIERWPELKEVLDKKSSILDEAKKIAGFGAERARDYGHPLTNHDRIAKGWNLIIEENLKSGSPITARQAALMMIWLKLAREIQTPKRDNIVDIAGYAECIGDIDDAVARSKNGV